jgi:dihydrofolate reductase
LDSQGDEFHLHNRSNTYETGGAMSKLRFNISMSLDGFVAGPDQSAQDPLGKRGEELHQWLLPLAAFREPHGEEGGEVNSSTPVVEGWWENVGAFVMGRNMFGGGPGPWGEPPWRGWWGEDPPFHRPVFVLTHHARDPLELEGGTTFSFVTDGIESALEQARNAAGGKDVSLAGGADVVQQYLAAGLVDEMEIAIVPVLLGGGTRLFERLGDLPPELRQVRAIEAPGVIHLSYEVAG